jgi:tetratricopeptide (TPR) repeat protein
LRSDSLKAEAQDSLAAETARALREANAQLADSAAVEAAGWAQQALYYDSGNAEASRVLAQAQLISRRQAAERAMMSAAADGDTAQALAAAQALLVQFPDHEVARQYVRRFAPMAEAVTIETIQSDTEAWTWYTHALVAFREGRFEEAIQWWEQVLARYPGSEDTRKNLEQARLRLDSGKD